MICVPCRSPDHSGCPGGSWCDCQHEGAQVAPPGAARHALMVGRLVSDVKPPVKVIRISTTPNSDGGGTA